MVYPLSSLIAFSREVEKKCELARKIDASSGIPAARFQEESWEPHQKEVKKCFYDLEEETNKKRLESYAQAINLASQFLNSDKKEIEDDRLVFLSKHLEQLSTHAKQLLEIQFELPQPVKEVVQVKPSQGLTFSKDFLNNIESLKGVTEEKTEAAKRFLNSPEFNALKAYRDHLRNNKHDHHFFCINFAVQSKHRGLTTLIKALESQTSMPEINAVLQAFYQTKGIQYADPHLKSIYDFLNTGQGLWTRLFGWKTTTIGIIDNLNEFAKISHDNDGPDLSPASL